MKALAASGEKGMFELLLATHTGMTTDEFTKTVVDWIGAAQHPRFKRPYTDLVYRPMVELLAHLRANGFKTYIVSGGTVEFTRPWTERTYGIPPEQVVGTSFVTTFKLGSDGKPVLLRRAMARATGLRDCGRRSRGDEDDGTKVQYDEAIRPC